MTRQPSPTEAVDPMVSGRPEAAQTDRGECLVIILGQTRASGATSESFDRFLVAPLAQGGRVDIALCRCSGYGEDDGYYASRASYVWEIPEPESWNPLFDEVAGEAAANAGVARPADWRTLINIRGNWLGEIDEAEGKRPGSAARCLYLRRHALGMIRSLGLENRYRWFILTRSDYLYLFDHPPLRLLDSRHTWLPRGQDSQGITDRHAVFSAASLRRVLGVLDELLLSPSVYQRSMTRYGDWNFEKFLKLALQEHSSFSQGDVSRQAGGDRHLVVEGISRREDPSFRQIPDREVEGGSRCRRPAEGRRLAIGESQGGAQGSGRPSTRRSQPAVLFRTSLLSVPPRGLFTSAGR